MKHIGIDIGGTSIKGAVIENGAVTARAKRSTDTSRGRDSIKDCIFEVIKSLLPLIGTDAGIGIGSAGDIDPYEGKVLYATDNLPGFTGFEIKRDVESAFNRRSFVVNDAVACHYRRVIFRRGKGLQKRRYADPRHGARRRGVDKRKAAHGLKLPRGTDRTHPAAHRRARMHLR